MIAGKIDGWDAKRRARDKERNRFWKRRSRLPKTVGAFAFVAMIVVANIATALGLEWKDAAMLSLGGALFTALFSLSKLTEKSDGWIEE